VVEYFSATFDVATAMPYTPPHDHNSRNAQPLTPKQLKAMGPQKALRGRPKSENKKLLVSVRYSPEVVA
jgi:uncharacterized protein (DUF4415 family)